MEKYIDGVVGSLEQAYQDRCKIEEGIKLKNNKIEEEIKLKNETQFIEAHYGFLKERTGQSNFLGEYGELSAMAASGDQFIARGLVFKTNAKNIGNSYEQEVIGAVKNLRTPYL